MRLRNLLRQTIGRENFCLSAQDVRKIIGVDAGSFQQWLARELIPFETVKAGKRTFRRFHVRDIPRLVLISEIWSNGVPISEALLSVDTILNWKYEPGLVPSGILYFRQINIIYFATTEESFSDVFREYGCASCIHLHVDELIRKAREALATAKNRNELGGK
jgi:hypothetical protein